ICRPERCKHVGIIRFLLILYLVLPLFLFLVLFLAFGLLLLFGCFILLPFCFRFASVCFKSAFGLLLSSSKFAAFCFLSACVKVRLNQLKRNSSHFRKRVNIGFVAIQSILANSVIYFSSCRWVFDSLCSLVKALIKSELCSVHCHASRFARYKATASRMAEEMLIFRSAQKVFKRL